MLARPPPLQGVGPWPRDGLAQAGSRRLGPGGEIDAWTLAFAHPHVEAGFSRSNREQLRSSFRRIIVVISCGVPVMLCHWYVDDVSEYAAHQARIMRWWQLGLQLACAGVELLALTASVVLSDYGLISVRGMEVGAVVAVIVAELHACVKMKHYIARAFGCSDPSGVWGLDLTGSDATFLLGLLLCVSGSGMMVRWKAFVPLSSFSVLGYVAAAYLLGGPDMRPAALNLILLAFIVLVMCCGKRSSEYQARLLHLSCLREKQMRCQAEFSLECLRDRRHEESHAGGSSYIRQLVADVHADCGGVPFAERSRCSPSSVPSAPLSAPAWLGPAAAECAAEAGDGAAIDCPDCLPVDASVWVEGRAESCSLRDLERGQRVLCYDSLGRTIRYAEVLENQSDLRWVSIGLDDGTQLAMTADHPVTLANQGESVRAADLSPGKDSVVVHRVVAAPVAVKQLSWQPEARGARGRAYLAVRHPDRHLVLVADAGAEPQLDASPTAVRSVDAGAVAAGHVMCTRGALLHFHSALEGPSPRAARPRSEPPRLLPAAAEGPVRDSEAL